MANLSKAQNERASERTSWSSQSYLNEPIWVTGLSWSGRRDSRIEMKEDGRKEGRKEGAWTYNGHSQARNIAPGRGRAVHRVDLAGHT